MNKIVQEAKDNFDLVQDTISEQELREREDLKFQVPELQWDDTARRQRQGGIVQGTNANLPARPIISIPRISQPIQLILNQQRNAHLGVNVHPLSENANKDTAEVIQGLYRKIERDSRADIARAWAFDRAVKVGRGCYRVDVKYDDEGGHPFDLKITIDRILYQAQVYLDPAATQPDWSDGCWAFLVHWMDLQKFRDKYDKAKFPVAGEGAWKSAIESDPRWVKQNGKERACLIAEYWKKTYEKASVSLLRDGRAVMTSTVQDRAMVVAEREIERPKITWYTLTGVEDEPLDTQEWAGKYIPLVPTIGQELQPFDDQRRWSGVIGPAKDGQRLYNFAAATLVEEMATEPKAPYVLDPRQIQGYESWWQQLSVRSFPFLPYKSTFDSGQLIPPPARSQTDTSGMQLAMMALREADGFLQSTTSTFDPSLGRATDQAKERSGKALLALQGQSDAANSNWLQNLAEVSMTLEAKIVLDLLPKVYNRPGRIAEILDGEDKTRRVMLNVPYTERNEQMTPVRDNIVPNDAEHYDLRTGVYGVSVSIGKGFQTRLQHGEEALGTLLPNLPPEMQIAALPTFLHFLDVPGAQELSDIAGKIRDRQFPFLSGDDKKQTPEQLKAMLDAAQQELEQSKQGIAVLTQEIQTQKAKQQAQIQTAAGKDAATLHKTKLETDTDLRIEQMKTEFETWKTQFQAAHEAALKAMELKIDAAREDKAQEHEEKMVEKQQRHEASEGNRDRAHEVAIGAMSQADGDAEE